MKLSLNISPCPNDTFMFDAMINHRIDTEGLEFDVTFADIEQLNTHARNTAAQVTKVSYAVVPQLLKNYNILSSGSALGNGNGPLLVSANDDFDINDYSMRVAIPGEHTTANLLMNKIFPHFTRKQPFLFSDIMSVVSKGICDAGVLIHEGRFTYRSRGLCLMADLGIEWEKRTKLPLPLGAIMVSRKMPRDIAEKVNRVLRRSIEYAFANPCESKEFVRSHAQEMDEEVTKSHIELFVNDYSLDLGATGRKAVTTLLNLSDETAFID